MRIGRLIIHRMPPSYSERAGLRRVFRIGRTAFLWCGEIGPYFWCGILGHEWNDTACCGGIITEQTCRRCAVKRMAIEA